MKHPKSSSETKQKWTFFTNHTHALVYLALNGDAPLKDVAQAIGVTERSMQRIIKELEDSGVLTHEKVGRCNQYSLNYEAALRHPLEQHCNIGQILEIILKSTKKRKSVQH